MYPENIKLAQVFPQMDVEQHLCVYGQSKLLRHRDGLLQFALASGLDGVGHPEGFISKKSY